jgi:Pro-kumamolisin, activation domain/Subtilase family
MDAKKRSVARLTATTLAGLALAAPGAFGEATPAQAVRIGVAPALPTNAQQLGVVPAAKPLKLTVALASQDPSGLAEFASEVSDPSSPRFRQYLNVAQFARRFGATLAQVTAVREALRAHGLTVGVPTANDLTLPVSGTAAQAEQAFATPLSQVELADGRTAYANADAPAISASVAPFVQGIIGLDDLSRDQPQEVDGRSLVRRSDSASARLAQGGRAGNVQVATGGPQPCEAAQELQQPFEFATGKSAAGVTADQVATAYQLPGMYRAGDFGAGQAIALFEQEAFLPSDIASYQSCFGTSATVTPIDVDGGPEPSEEGDVEAALDIEQVIGLAPQAHVLVYQGPIEQNVAPIDIISRIVSDDRAKVISTSWGICEELTDSSVIAGENTLLQEAAAQGQSFFSASGDSGSEQCSQFKSSNKSISVLNPASQPFATGVGGTTLFSRREGEFNFYTGELAPSESVWNDGSGQAGGATGGGLSQKWAMPSYQASAAPRVGVVKAALSGGSCGGAALCREVPDVAANADSRTGYIVFADIEEEDGWTFVGGTSAAAPLWAALTALANASPACHGLSIGFANPSLYSLAGSTYTTDFRDISEASIFTGRANNNELSESRPFPISAQYDMATGIGAPIGEVLADGLCELASAPHEAEATPVPSGEGERIVASAPTPLPVNPPQPQPQPTPQSQSQSTTVASASFAQLKSLLTAQLTPSGKTAITAALIKTGGYSLSFKAPEAGSLTIAWYELPPGAQLAKRAKPKPLLVAIGQVKFSAAGTKSVKLKLTTAGKALLKRSKHVKLTAKGTFTSSGKAAVSATKVFTLKR